MSMPKLKADLDNGTGDVAFPRDWDSHNALLRADLIRDWLFALNWEYERAVASIFPEDRGVEH
jgi:hypothetical protein